VKKPDNIIQLQTEHYNNYGNLFDLDHPHASLWFEQIKARNRIRFLYVENGDCLAQVDIVKDYGERNIGDETDYTIPGRRVYLSRLFVQADKRRQGIGSIMVNYICETARKWGYSEISLGVNIDNTAARSLYEKNGFNTVIYCGEDEHGKYEKLLKYL